MQQNLKEPLLIFLQKSKFLRVLLFTVTIVLIAVIEFGSGQLVKINDCTCPGDIVTYNCNVIGGGFTIWRGSAFDCPNVDSMILLRHSKFEESSGTMGQCNSGTIRGQSIGTSTDSLGNTVYTSQLMINLTASPSVISQTIECVYRNPSGIDTLVGTTVLEITDPPRPPTNIHLVSVSPKQLVFNWTSVESNCSTLQYNVVSNCGTCLGVTNRNVTSVTCSIDFLTVTDDVMLCYFGISSAICANANISGNLSTPLDVMLKIPPSPIISSAIPHYNKTDNKLIDLDIKFHEAELFNISNGVDGSALNYTIFYTDSNTGDICYSLTISASSCVKGVCTVPSISPLPCSERTGDGNIVILISASNHLGTGSSSFTTIGQTNKYFNITLETTNKISCTHLNHQESQSTVICDVVYWSCQHHQQPTAKIARGSMSSPNTVNIDLPETPPTSDYCYAVTASNGTFTVIIEGWIKSNISDCCNSRTSGDDCTVAVVAGCVVITLIVIFVTVVAVVTVIVVHPLVTQINWKKLTTHSYKQLPSSDIIEAHVIFDVEDEQDQFLHALKVFHKDYDISTLHVGTASRMNNGFKRTVYIKFDLSCRDSKLFQNFDEFASKLGPNNKPAEIMRESIKVYPGLISIQIGNVWTKGRQLLDKDKDTMIIESDNDKGGLLKILQSINEVETAEGKPIPFGIIDIEIFTEPDKKSGKIYITTGPGLNRDSKIRIQRELPIKCGLVKSVKFS